jgi:hypothetical protein
MDMLELIVTYFPMSFEYVEPHTIGSGRKSRKEKWDEKKALLKNGRDHSSSCLSTSAPKA